MALAQEAPAIATSAARRGHIVDLLIEERAPKLAGSPLWPIVRPLLYRMLDYRKARRMADAIAPMPGKAAIDFCSELLALKVEARGLERLPRAGRLILICNHPTGIADGVAVYDAIKALRPDVMFYANADAHRLSPRLDEVLIPVEWVEEKRTREKTRLTLTMTRQAMEAERALVIFPAGRIARRQANGDSGRPGLGADRALHRPQVRRPGRAGAHGGAMVDPVPFFRPLLGRAARHHRLPRAAEQARRPLRGERRPDHRRGRRAARRPRRNAAR